MKRVLLAVVLVASAAVVVGKLRKPHPDEHFDAEAAANEPQAD